MIIFEPSDLYYWGMEKSLDLLRIRLPPVLRINSLSGMDNVFFCNNARMFLFSAGANNEYAIPLLRLLSGHAGQQHQLPIIVILGESNQEIENLFLAFGVYDVISYDITESGLQHSLAKVLSGVSSGHDQMLLSPKERFVVRQVLTGSTMTQIARSINRDIRTVSAHKQNALLKLKLTQTSDLHILASHLSCL